MAVFIVNCLDSDVTFSHNHNDAHERIGCCSPMVFFMEFFVSMDMKAIQVQCLIVATLAPFPEGCVSHMLTSALQALCELDTA